MKKFRHLIVVVLLLTAGLRCAFADAGHDHSHAPTHASSGTSLTHFSLEASSMLYEVLIRYSPIEEGEKTRLTLFISEFENNKPVDRATLKISAPDDPSMQFSIAQSGEGTYTVETSFREKKKYRLNVQIQSALGADLIAIGNIEVGKQLPPPETEMKSEDLNWKHYLAGLGLVITGAVLGFLFRKKNTTAGKTSIILILLCLQVTIPSDHSIAHGDEPHGAAAGSGNLSGSFDVPKETQFLFEVYTQKVRRGNFNESTSLFGTIIPGPDGQARITSPQNGIISSIHVKVGQDIKAGQVIVSIEPNLDPADRVNLSSERNSLEAEYEAARKDLERLESISDIAAKRELDEARARMNRVQANLRLLKDGNGKAIMLRSPIDGKISGFNLSSGSTINAGQLLFTVNNLSNVYAEAQVFDKDAPKLKSGATFTVECANDDHKTSEVMLVSLAQEINATNQSQRVLFSVNNPEGDFKIGEFVNIRVFEPDGSQAISLPNSALSEINGKAVVFIKQSAEHYEVRYIQTAENNGQFTRIMKGISEDERVVVNASYQLKMIFLNQ